MRTENEYREIVNRALEPQLRSLGDVPGKLMDAMLYSLLAGGKRLRPVLLLASCEMAGGDLAEALPFACALEMIHTYSLIHDDLPGMDNDELRRGRPTNHIQFGEGLAILAGDGLLNSAFEICLRTSIEKDISNGLRATEILARHAGVTGMIAGQVKDVTLEGHKPTEESVTYIHTHKTSDLLQAPIEMGLCLAGASDDVIECGRQYGLHLGFAFQIRDDILDVTGDPSLLGKNIGMDQDKQTWVALRGLEQAEKDAEQHAQFAIEALKPMPWDHSFFDQIALANLNRKQ